MIRNRKIPPKVIDALAKGILHCVTDRIVNDPDVADTYLRVTVNGNKFTVRAMYMEESLEDGIAGQNDVSLLDLMTDLNDCQGDEQWVPNEKAIRKLAEEFSDTLDIDFSLN